MHCESCIYTPESSNVVSHFVTSGPHSNLIVDDLASNPLQASILKTVEMNSLTVKMTNKEVGLVPIDCQVGGRLTVFKQFWGRNIINKINTRKLESTDSIQIPPTLGLMLYILQIAGLNNLQFQGN